MKTYVVGTHNLEMSSRGASNDYPQHTVCFCGEIKKNINTFGLKKKAASYQELWEEKFS